MDGSLGSAVGVAAGIGHAPGHGADVHHVGGIQLPHLCDHRLAHVEQSLEVGVDHGVPVVGITPVDGVQPQRQPGVVDQDMHFAPFQDFGQGLLHRQAVAHVQRMDLQRAAGVPGELFP